MIGVIADVHLDNYTLGGGSLVAGVNARAKLVLKTLSRCAQECSTLFILGDVFDHPNPSPQLVEALMGTLEDMVGFGGCDDVHIIRGNHDAVSQTPRDHALVSLGRVTGVHVYDKPALVAADDYKVYLAPWPHPPACDDADILMFHQGIGDDQTPAFMHGYVHVKQVRAYMKKAGAGAAFAGDWHQAKSFGGHVYQCGTITPHSWSDTPANTTGRLWLVDQGFDISYVEIPGPRFLEAASAEEASALARKHRKMGNSPFITVPTGEGLPPIEGVVYKVESVNTEKAASDFAHVARSVASTNTDEVLAAYLQAKHPDQWEPMLRYIQSLKGAARD